MTDKVIAAFVDLDSLRSCANDPGPVDEGLKEQGLPLALRMKVVAAVSALAVEPGAAPPPAEPAAEASPAERRRLQAAKSYSEGLAWKNEKKWPIAVAAFQYCVALDANHSSAWFELGLRLDESSEAQIEAYQRCIALDPKDAAAHNNLGNVLKNVRKDYDGAEKLFRKAIEICPTALRCNNLATLLKDVRKD